MEFDSMKKSPMFHNKWSLMSTVCGKPEGATIRVPTEYDTYRVREACHKTIKEYDNSLALIIVVTRESKFIMKIHVQAIGENQVRCNEIEAYFNSRNVVVECDRHKYILMKIR